MSGPRRVIYSVKISSARCARETVEVEIVRDKSFVYSTQEVFPSFAQMIVDPVRISRVTREIHSKKVKLVKLAVRLLIIFESFLTRWASEFVKTDNLSPLVTHVNKYES